MSRIVLVIFFLEVGFVLVLAPWSAYWDRNYFAETMPWVDALITNNFFRGAITGLGIVNLCAGVAEIASLILGRHSRRDPDLSIADSRPVDK